MTDLTIELMPSKKAFKILEQSDRMYQSIISCAGKMIVCSACYPAINTCTLWLRGTWKKRDNDEVRCGNLYPYVVDTFNNLKKEGYNVQYEMRMKL